ncbi:MAG TPA: amylo-alpha-1,6-glucosidase [Thermodesulfobacteriota bacterium]|nr:amylo-alpha-1,6-glucosidase [Thermodesulfobacteriota bacterium]
MTIEFGRDICYDPRTSERKEWLVTNGIGGFASGTVAGILTRRYHGLLVAALKPPLGRNLLVTKLDETASYEGRNYPLSANRWSGGTVDPQGYINIERFYLDGAIPVWEYACADAILEKRIWMAEGLNTTYIRYELKRASRPLSLDIKAFVNYRDYHSSTHAGGWRMNVEKTGKGVRVLAYGGAVPFYVLSDTAESEAENDWYYGFNLAIEEYRGLDHIEDHLHAARLRRTLAEGQSFTIIASTDESAGTDGDKALSLRKEYERDVLARFLTKQKPTGLEIDSDLNQLALAADQFIVSRPSEQDKNGKSVIAGYHWFGDWGRDTMISLPGLTIAAGRPEIAKSIIRTFSAYVDQGMLPNRFPDAGEKPEYNTVDATLWYFEAVREYFEDTGDKAFLGEIFPVLDGIIDWHNKGTRYNIKVDPEDGLLYAGENGVQLTWMDAKVGDWVVTPRIGKPVEVNALWYNALRTMAKFAGYLGKPAKKYETAADKALSGFSRFWNESTGYCFDVIDGPSGDDPSLRPNQLFTVSLPESALDSDRQEKIVEACALSLLTSHGLRSLSPGHPDYKGRYGGDSRSRDGAYHQGTVWGWLLGHFALAHMKVHGDPEKARGFLMPMLGQLRSHGVGSLSEIFDGDAPMTPRGCIAQAWTVAETIRAFSEIQKRSDKKSKVKA